MSSRRQSCASVEEMCFSVCLCNVRKSCVRFCFHDHNNNSCCCGQGEITFGRRARSRGRSRRPLVSYFLFSLPGSHVSRSTRTPARSISIAWLQPRRGSPAGHVATAWSDAVRRSPLRRLAIPPPRGFPLQARRFPARSSPAAEPPKVTFRRTCDKLRLSHQMSIVNL